MAGMGIFFTVNNSVISHTTREHIFVFKLVKGVVAVGRNKSKRFVQQGKVAVEKHDERIPYHLTYAEAEANKLSSKVEDSSLGGI
jgi:hypothetical protein